MGYQRKDERTLTYQEGVKRLRQEARLVMDRVLNEAIAAWSAECEDAKQSGAIVELNGDRESLRKYLAAGTRKALTK